MSPCCGLVIIDTNGRKTKHIMDAARFRWYFNKIVSHDDEYYATPIFKESEALAKFGMKRHVLNRDVRTLRDALGIDLIPMDVYGNARTKTKHRHRICVDKIFLPRLVEEYEVTYFDSRDQPMTRIADARYRDHWIFKVILGGKKVGQKSFRTITVTPGRVISIHPTPPNWKRVTDVDSLEFRTTEMIIKDFKSQ